MAMNPITNVSPANGTPVVWCAVEKATGHAQCGLGEWSADLEAQLLDAAYASFWTHAYLPMQARVAGAINITRQELVNAEINVNELDARLTHLEKYIEEISEHVHTGTVNAAGKD